MRLRGGRDPPGAGLGSALSVAQHDAASRCVPPPARGPRLLESSGSRRARGGGRRGLGHAEPWGSRRARAGRACRGCGAGDPALRDVGVEVTCPWRTVPAPRGSVRRSTQLGAASRTLSPLPRRGPRGAVRVCPTSAHAPHPGVHGPARGCAPHCCVFGEGCGVPHCVWSFSGKGCRPSRVAVGVWGQSRASGRAQCGRKDSGRGLVGGATWASHPFWARPPHLSAEGGPGRRGTPLLAKAPARGRLVRFPRRSVGVHSPHRDAQREAAALGGECGGLPSAITCLSSVRLSTESPVHSVGHPAVHRPPPRATGGGCSQGRGSGPCPAQSSRPSAASQLSEPG